MVRDKKRDNNSTILSVNLTQVIQYWSNQIHLLFFTHVRWFLYSWLSSSCGKMFDIFCDIKGKLINLNPSFSFTLVRQLLYSWRSACCEKMFKISATFKGKVIESNHSSSFTHVRWFSYSWLSSKCGKMFEIFCGFKGI